VTRQSSDEGSEVRRLLSVLRERPHSVDPERTLARREQALPHLRAHVRELAERRARMNRRRLVVAAIAAFVGLVGLGVGLDRVYGAHGNTASIVAVEGHLVHHDSGASRTVAEGERLALPLQGELQTESGTPARLETSEGLEMRLEGGSRLGMTGLSATGTEKSVELEQGQIGCHVPKLPGGSHFSVVTPNARVVVHGTRFTVRVDSSEAGVTRTCVRVTDGVVAVQHASGEATLHAGEEWGCRVSESETADDARETGAEGVGASQPADEARPAVRAPRRGGSRAVLRDHERDDKREGTLAEETALLQTALAAERKGQRTTATTAIMRLLSRYPDSPLAPEARTVLERVSHPPTEAP
jgi:hypothetical protein